MTAEEYIEEMNGHNSWQHYPPSKQKVIGWLKQFAEMQVEAINYNRCCTEVCDNKVEVLTVNTNGVWYGGCKDEENA